MVQRPETYPRFCRFWLVAISVPVLAIGCRKSHAASEKAWSLEVKTRGAVKRKALRYRFAKNSWGQYRLTLSVTARGVRVVEKATIHLEIRSRGGGDRGYMELEITSYDGPGKRHELAVDNSQKMHWVINAAGRTVRFSDENIDPSLAAGLPDLGLLLRRMLPVLPNESVGAGARWALHRPVETGINEKSGSGALRTSERVEYTLTALGRSAGAPVAKLEGRLNAEYDGAFRAVARDLSVKGKGQGTLNVTLDLASGTLETARLEFADQLRVVASGRARAVQTKMVATLSRRVP